MSILGSSANCNQGSQNANALTNKYCGSILNPTAGAKVNVPICGKIFDRKLALAVLYNFEDFLEAYSLLKICKIVL